MPMHLQDFVGQHPYLFWLLLAPLFGAAEALLAGAAADSGRRTVRADRGRWFLVMPACAVAAVVAAVAPGLWWLQAIVAVAVALAAQWLLRPRLFPATP